MAPLLSLQGKPSFLLGVNYWSRAGGPRMWNRFDAAVARAELQQMKGIGLNVCRCFAFIPTFMPRPPHVDKTALGRFRAFLDLCREESMGAIPSFLVGHMSGENYDFPGQEGRSLYTDGEILGWQKELVRGLVEAGAGNPAVTAFLASNEMPNWGGPAAPAVIASWATALRQTVREKDERTPFSLGDGAMNLQGGQNGFDPSTLRGAVDFLGPHTYYAEEDPLRQAYNAEFCLRSLSYLGLPVLLEEFGAASSQASDENQALYYREVIHACLGVGAAGAMGWCFSDFDLEAERPYSHHAFELGFGLTRADGSEKPVCDELRGSAALIAKLDYPRLVHPRPRAAILVPSYFNSDYPFCRDDRKRMHRTLLQAYALCGAAGIEVELVPEGQNLAAYRLILCPSTQKLLATTWRDLLDHARAGKTVYWSYFAGDQPVLQGAWCHCFEELTGCRHLLRYACFDLPGETTRLQGSGLDLTVATTVGRASSRAYLPLEPLAAEVIARDETARPALTRAVQGSGQVLFLDRPWEHYLAGQIGGDLAAVALYRLLAERAGLSPAVTSSDPTVQVRVVQRGERSLLWVINHGWSEASTSIDSPGGEPLHGTLERLGEGSAPLALAPKAACIYQLAGPPLTTP